MTKHWFDSLYTFNSLAKISFKCLPAAGGFKSCNVQCLMITDHCSLILEVQAVEFSLSNLCWSIQVSLSPSNMGHSIIELLNDSFIKFLKRVWQCFEEWSGLLVVCSTHYLERKHILFSYSGNSTLAVFNSSIYVKAEKFRKFNNLNTVVVVLYDQGIVDNKLRSTN